MRQGALSHSTYSCRSANSARNPTAFSFAWNRPRGRVYICGEPEALKPSEVLEVFWFGHGCQLNAGGTTTPIARPVARLA